MAGLIYNLASKKVSFRCVNVTNPNPNPKKNYADVVSS
jgi:hypothetical protein